MAVPTWGFSEPVAYSIQGGWSYADCGLLTLDVRRLTVVGTCPWFPPAAAVLVAILVLLIVLVAALIYYFGCCSCCGRRQRSAPEVGDHPSPGGRELRRGWWGHPGGSFL